MTRNVRAMSPYESLLHEHAAQLMDEPDVGVLPVCGAGGRGLGGDGLPPA